MRVGKLSPAHRPLAIKGIEKRTKNIKNIKYRNELEEKNSLIFIFEEKNLSQNNIQVFHV